MNWSGEYTPDALYKLDKDALVGIILGLAMENAEVKEALQGWVDQYYSSRPKEKEKSLNPDGSLTMHKK